MDRRTLLRRGGLMVFGAGLPLASNAQSPIARFRGTRLRIHYPAHPHFERVERQFANFTDLTGIRIEGLRTPYLGMKAQQLASFAKPAGDFDLVAYLISWKMEYALGGALLPLERMFADRALELAPFQFGDLIGPYVDAIGRVGGPKGYLPGPGARLYGLPCGAETSVLAARNDLLHKHGLQMPVDYAQLLHACRVLRDKEGIAGLATRGKQGHHITHAWLLHLTPHGGAVFDAGAKAALQRSGGMRATEVLREIASMAQPKAREAGLSEMQEAFLRGGAAFYLDSSSILGVARDPARTSLTSRIGYAMHPSGTRLSGQVGGFGLGIAANSPQPHAAFLFLQWLLSPSTDLAIARDGGAAARWSTLSDPDFRALPRAVRHAFRTACGEPGLATVDSRVGPHQPGSDWPGAALDGVRTHAHRAGPVGLGGVDRLRNVQAARGAGPLKPPSGDTGKPGKQVSVPLVCLTNQ